MKNTTGRWFLVLFLLALAGVRWLFIPWVELAPDEAYYYLWSQHLDWGYYSKGPGVALAIRLGTDWFGQNEFGVRCLSPLLSLGTAVMAWGLARRMFNEGVAFWTVMTSAVLPIFWVGSLVMTIDPLSIFFWAAAALTFWLAIEQTLKFHGWWLLSGVLIGLGFLCKYTNAFQLLTVVLFLASSRRTRSAFRHAGFWSLLGGFCAMAWPPLIWNAQNLWITVTHLKERGGAEDPTGWEPTALGEFFLVHFGVYSPLIFLGIVIAAWKLKGISRSDPRVRYLMLSAAPLIVFYALISVKKAGEANWTAPAFVSLIILAVYYWLDVSRKSRGMAVLCLGSLGFGAILSLLVLSTDFIRDIGVDWSYQRDPSGRLRGWKNAALSVDKFRSIGEQVIGAPVFLIANRYQTAAELGFYLPHRPSEGAGHPPVYIPESQSIENQFSFWPRYDEFREVAKNAPAPDPMFKEQRAVNPFVGRSALYITDRMEEGPPSPIVRAFEKVELAGEFDVSRRGLMVKRWRVYLCWNYETLPL